jgi:4-amino-4-deoxy-L-arabinose transferase-like glycosyltransferase
MNKIKIMKEHICLVAIVIMSTLLNFANLRIEGYSNQYYAAGVKSMAQSLKNFFFVSMDPAGFVTIDKPPLGFWVQVVSAKIFGFSGWSILLPQALAGVLSTVLIYMIVKKSFGRVSGLISALCLSVTPVFVAVNRNNTIDNQLVLVLLLACWALSASARNGKFKYLVLGMVLIGLGFNIKALQAYMILPASYVMYLLSNRIPIKKRVAYLLAGTAIMLAVSFSWALIVDAIPASSRPYVGSSGNNTEMGLIIGHNGSERLNLSSIFGNTSNQQSSGMGGFGQGGPGPGTGGFGQGDLDHGNRGQSGPGPGGNFSGGGPRGGSGLAGTFGNQTPAGITRLFSKNILADQIVWFLPLAFLGFIAASIKERLRIRLDNDKKQSLILWGMWLLPEFVYFSFNTGLFHPHYLTMMAPPVAALAGIGIVSMWEMFKEGSWKSWFLPLVLLANGAVQMLMLSYFYNSSPIVKILIGLIIGLSFVPVLILSGINILKIGLPKINKVLASLGVAGILISPMVGSVAAMFYAVNSGNPAAGLELLPAQLAGNKTGAGNMDRNNNQGLGFENVNTADLVKFLDNHKVNGKSQIIVTSANIAENITINTNLYVGSLSGFAENETLMSLEQFKARVKSGEIRYVLANSDNGRDNSGSEIMDWVKKNGKLVSYVPSNSTGSSSQNNSEQLYDLVYSVKD